MASRSFRETPSTQSSLSTQRSIFSAVSAVSAVIAVVGTIATAQTPDRARTEALARRATERLQALQREADRLASEERTVLGDLRKLEVERQLNGEQLKHIDADVAAVQREIDDAAERMA